MRALLVHQKVAGALDKPENLPQTLTEADRKEMDEIAYSLIILYLGDNVLRHVDEVTTAAALREKLEKLYISKSLPNKIYLKEKFFGYRMDSSKTLDENLDDFNRICLELASTGEKMSDENQVVILLNSLPESYKEIKAAIKYGRDSLTLDTVLSALRSKELEMKSEKKDAEVLFTRGRTEKQGTNQNKQTHKSRLKSRGKGKRCYYCHKERHIRRNCYQLKAMNKQANTEKKEEGTFASVHEGYDSAEVLAISDE